MTEPTDPLARAFARLRGELPRLAAMPPATQVRARARRQQRTRRAGAGVLAAVAVAAVVVGADTVLQPVSAPAPPAQSPDPAPPSPIPSPVVSPDPEPDSRPMPQPDPRPAPLPVRQLDDPIAEVDWRTATVDIPAREGCPAGPVQMVPVGELQSVFGPADGYPRIWLDATDPGYGDLTGDGRAEAVVEASCATTEEGGDHGHQLLVVARHDDGTLVGLDWVGPRGAGFGDYWVDDGRLLISADPWVTGEEDHFVPVPGLALAYQWDGSGFTGWQPAPEYPPIVRLDGDGLPPPVWPGRAIAAGLGCDTGDRGGEGNRSGEEELRFVAEPSGGLWTASGSGGLYVITARPLQHFLFDLDRTGERLLVVGLRCVAGDGTEAEGLAVFERDQDGWRGISVLPRPTPADQLFGWRKDGERLIVEWSGPSGEIAVEWDGTVLRPVDG